MQQSLRLLLGKELPPQDCPPENQTQVLYAGLWQAVLFHPPTEEAHGEAPRLSYPNYQHDQLV